MRLALLLAALVLGHASAARYSNGAYVAWFRLSADGLTVQAKVDTAAAMSCSAEPGSYPSTLVR